MDGAFRDDQQPTAVAAELVVIAFGTDEVTIADETSLASFSLCRLLQSKWSSWSERLPPSEPLVDADTGEVRFPDEKAPAASSKVLI